jgi:Bacterial Ig-like domain
VTVEKAPGQADPATKEPVLFIATFSEPTTGFSAGDVDFSQSTVFDGTPGLQVSPIGAKDGTQFELRFTGMDHDGVVVASIPAGVAKDADGFFNLTSTSTDNSVTFNGSPTVTLEKAPGQTDPATGEPVLFIATFSEPTTGFSAGDVDFSQSTAFVGTPGLQVSPIGAKDGTQFELRFTGIDQDGTVVASIPAGKAQDADGFFNLASTSTDNVVQVDITAPTVTVEQAPAQADPTSATTISFLATFSEPVTGFTNGDVVLGGTAGATTAQVTEVSPNDGTTYRIDVTGMTQDGTVTASIGAGAVTDAVGHASQASSSTDNVVTFDTIPPTPTITQDPNQADPTTTQPVAFVVTWDEPVTGFDAADVTLGGTANPAHAQVTEIGPMDGTTFRVTVDQLARSGTVTVEVPAGSVTDRAGNQSRTAVLTDNEVTVNFPAGGGGGGGTLPPPGNAPGAPPAGGGQPPTPSPLPPSPPPGNAGGGGTIPVPDQPPALPINDAALEGKVKQLFRHLVRRNPDQDELARLVTVLKTGDGRRLRAAIFASKAYFRVRGRGTNVGWLAALARDLHGLSKADLLRARARLAKGAHRGRVLAILLAHAE